MASFLSLGAALLHRGGALDGPLPLGVGLHGGMLQLGGGAALLLGGGNEDCKPVTTAAVLPRVRGSP